MKKKNKSDFIDDRRWIYCAKQLSRMRVSPDRVNVKHAYLPPSEKKDQDALIRACVDWAMKDDSMELDEFPTSLLISPYRFYNIAKTNEYFADGLQLAKALIANRLKKDVRERKLDKEYLFKLLPLYSDSYRDFLKDRYNAVVDKLSQPIELHLHKFPSSDEVPDRDVDDQ